MSQLQNLDVVYFENIETDVRKKVFEKDKKKEGKYIIWLNKPPLWMKILGMQLRKLLSNTNLVNSFPRIRFKKKNGLRAQE